MIPILVVSLVGSPEFPTMAELMQVFLEDVGFQTEMVEMDWAVFAGLRRAREQFSTSLLGRPCPPIGAAGIALSMARPATAGAW